MGVEAIHISLTYCSWTDNVMITSGPLGKFCRRSERSQRRKTEGESYRIHVRQGYTGRTGFRTDKKDLDVFM